MTFEIAFDASHPRFDVDAVGFILFSLAGALLIAHPNIKRTLMSRLQERTRTIVSWCVLILGLSLAPLALLNAYQARRTAAADLSQGHYAIAEGPVVGFTPLLSQTGRPLGGRFTVAGHRFAYTNSEAAPGFHGPSTLVRDGTYVRILYAGDVILRVDVGHRT